MRQKVVWVLGLIVFGFVVFGLVQAVDGKGRSSDWVRVHYDSTIGVVGGMSYGHILFTTRLDTGPSEAETFEFRSAEWDDDFLVGDTLKIFTQTWIDKTDGEQDWEIIDIILLGRKYGDL